MTDPHLRGFCASRRAALRGARSYHAPLVRSWVERAAPSETIRRRVLLGAVALADAGIRLLDHVSRNRHRGSILGRSPRTGTDRALGSGAVDARLFRSVRIR